MSACKALAPQCVSTEGRQLVRKELGGASGDDDQSKNVHLSGRNGGSGGGLELSLSSVTISRLRRQRVRAALESRAELGREERSQLTW